MNRMNACENQMNYGFAFTRRSPGVHPAFIRRSPGVHPAFTRRRSPGRSPGVHPAFSRAFIRPDELLVCVHPDFTGFYRNFPSCPPSSHFPLWESFSARTAYAKKFIFVLLFTKCNYLQLLKKITLHNNFLSRENIFPTPGVKMTSPLGSTRVKMVFLVHFLAKFVLLEISKLTKHKRVGSN